MGLTKRVSDLEVSIKDMDRKRKFVCELTDAATKAFGFPKEKIIVLLKETRPDNVGVGGELVSDHLDR